MPEPEGKADAPIARFRPISPSLRRIGLRYRSGDGLGDAAVGWGPMKEPEGIEGRPSDSRFPASICGRIVGEVGCEKGEEVGCGALGEEIDLPALRAKGRAFKLALTLVLANCGVDVKA